MLSEVKIHILSNITTDSITQLTVDGVTTESGVIAVLNVKEEPRLALEPALTLLHNMVVKTVRGTLPKHKLVTSNLVQVRNCTAAH